MDEATKQLADKSGGASTSNAVSPVSNADTASKQTENVKFSSGTAVKNSCGSTKGITNSYVYALGRINARFPRVAIEKEFAQATGREGKKNVGLTNQKALHSVLSDRENRYLVRELCWVLTIEGLDTYILHPRDPVDYDMLVEAIRPAPSPMDTDVVIGVLGPIAPPEMCNGLMVPIVGFDQIYSFDRPSFLDALKEKRPETIPEEEFTSAAEELFERILQTADNAGATDEHRAMNYLACRYDAIYKITAEAHGRNSSLTGIEVRPSRLSGVSRIVDVIFAYTNRETDVIEKYFVRVDVTEEFPFLVTKMSPYYDR